MKHVVLIGSFAFVVGAQAQLLTNNGAAITVLSGAQVTVKGDVLNAAGATIANNGTIDLSGDFTNNSGNDLFGSSQGTVLLNGGSQSIGGSSVTLFNNVSLLGGPVTLMQDISTGGYPVQNGVLALGSVQLFLNTQKLSVLNPAPIAITRTAGYIISETDPVAGYGEVQWFIGASAPGNYVFPFGNDITGHYLPVTLNTVVPGSGGSGSITCATYPTDPFASPNNRPLPTGLPTLTDMGGMENAPNVVDRFWPMQADDYATPPTAILTFTYRDSEWNSGTNTIGEGLLQAQRFNGSVWSQPPNGTVNTLTNTVTTSLTNNYVIVWALVQSSTPLPVELLWFDAQPMDEEVLCSWSTATELNNDYFTVERSADGLSFIDIGEVGGAGASQMTHDYAFADKQPLGGLSYYRLRQTDLDGAESWSDVVAVWRDAPSAELAVYPNPCTDRLFIGGSVPAGEHVLILDATGRVVIDAASSAGTSIDVSALPAGSYVVRTSNTSGSGSARFVKQ
ncbi:MAG: T9SS type A sorting domain-containing protein [Flavobacteriales bacterium]|nr:T9SS type A sorting domain-containing protein [Flavobacteriales bacterium]